MNVARTAPAERLSSSRALGLPLAFTLALLALGVQGESPRNASLAWSFAGAGAALLAWNAILLAAQIRRFRTLTANIVLRKQHYIQACAQASVLLYWGWHWPRVFDSAHLIAAQLAFAYAFDMLLCWSRRDTYTLGFGPVPIIFSINLFLWFKEDWFYLQFFMVALGLLAKELIRWNRDGRRVHVFNPSSLPLAVFSIGLLITGTSETTWGQDIAITQFYPPHMYLVLFLVGLPGQFLFGVTTMTMSAVVTTYAFGLLYFAATGIYFFYDSYIPIAIFLGMHLLFTDPSTSPRTQLGRVIFGVLYSLSSVALYGLLAGAGLPTFYDKLLQVPLLNLSTRLIDRTVRSKPLAAVDPMAAWPWLGLRQRHTAYIAIWSVVFAMMSAVQGLGDRHPGQWLPFWQQACREERPHACQYLANLQTIYCTAGSGWACNEVGTLYASAARAGKVDWGNPTAAFERGCALGFGAACRNVVTAIAGLDRWELAPATLGDFPIVLRGSKGPITDRTPDALNARACLQGWPNACGRQVRRSDD